MIKKVCTLLVLSISTLAATPNIYGPTGLITIPTAQSLKYKEFNMGFDYTFNDTDTNLDVWNYKLNLGTFENWELGIVGGSEPDEGVFLNVKYYLISDNSTQPLSIAIGSENLSSKHNTSIYMVASKKLRPDLGAHLGFRAVFSDVQLDPSVMAGINYLLTESIELVADLSGQEDQYSINAGAQLYLQQDLTLRAFFLDLASIKETGRYYGAGISFTKFL